MNSFLQTFGAKRAAQPALYPVGVSMPGGITLGISDTNPYRNSTDRLASYRGWIYKAVSTIAPDMAALKIEVRKQKRNGETEKLHKHPMLSLLARPNAYQRGNAFRQKAQIYLDLSGEFFVYIATGAGGQPVALHLLRPDRVLIVPDPVNHILGYIFYSESGAALAFLPEEVLHVKHAHPSDEYRGYSPVQALGFSPLIDDAVKAYVYNYVSKGARPQGVLSSEEDLTQPEVDVLRQRWSEIYQGVTQSGRIAVLGKGSKFQPIGDTISALNPKALSDYALEDVISAYNVPKTKMGLVADANRANADAADYTYGRNCLNPRVDLWVEDFLQPLLERFPDTANLEAAMQNPVPSDTAFEFKRAVFDLQAASITVKQYHQRLGNPEADTAPDVYLLPGGKLVVDKLVAGEQAGTGGAAADNPTNDTGKSGPGDTPDPPEDATKARQSRLRALFATEYAERKGGTYDQVGALARLALELGSETAAADFIREIEAQIQTLGLAPTYEVLKSSRGAGSLARLLETR
jgi:HK97 family phage portal protein